MDLPTPETLRWIVTTYARLLAAYGGAIGEPALVTPTAAFFPDAFRPDAASVDVLFRRMVDHAPLAADLSIRLDFVDDDAASQGGGCGSLACGSSPGAGARGVEVDEVEDGYRVRLAVADVAKAEVLTTSLGRAIGSMVLLEAGEPLHGIDAATSEVTAILCGFGVLLTNGAAVWAKACSGLRVAQATVLSVDEAAVALALFTAVHGRKPAEARRHLGLTQREAFDRAHDWVACNPRVVEALRTEPEWLEAGTFVLEPVRGIFGQWLRDRRAKKERTVALAAVGSAPALTPERRRWLEEARALMDESEPG